MATHNHKIYEEYILGKIVKVKDDFVGKIIGIEFNDVGTMLFIIEPFNGGNIFEEVATNCSFGVDKNMIPVTHNELLEALKTASKHRCSIADNISYACQISGEDISQYKDALAQADKTCNLLQNQLEKYKVVS